MQQTHIFFTGANGFIGSHLLRRLLTEGYRVTILLRYESDLFRISNLLNHPSLRRISISEMNYIFQSDTPDMILHLATCYRKYHQKEDISEMIHTNIDIPTQICQLCVTHCVKYFINTGTFFEYDHGQQPLTEASREKAFNLYASTKLGFNSILRYYTEQYNFRSLTIRLFSPYGPDDNQKLIPLAIKSMINDTEIEIPNVTQRLNFTYVDDIVDAYILSISKIPTFYNSYEVINIAHPKSTSLSEMLITLQEVTGKKLFARIGSGTESEIWHSSFGSNYAQEILGWQAKTPLNEGLLLTYKAYTNAI